MSNLRWSRAAGVADLPDLPWHGCGDPPKTLAVNLPAGVHDGATIRLSARGNPGLGTRLPVICWCACGFARIHYFVYSGTVMCK